MTTTYAIFTTDNGYTGRLEYVTEASSQREAFDTFADDLFSGGGSVEDGWSWHLYEIPERMADDNDAIQDYVADRHPYIITS